MEQGLYRTRLDLFENSTQSVLNVCIMFDTCKDIENCTVLEKNCVKRKTYKYIKKDLRDHKLVI